MPAVIWAGVQKTVVAVGKPLPAATVVNWMVQFRLISVTSVGFSVVGIEGRS